MFTKSIRWRMQLWQAFLLVGILSGFGVTVYQLYRTNQLSRMDEELARRASALSSDVRGRPPFGPASRRLPFERGRMTNENAFDFDQSPGRPPMEPGWDLPPPRRPGPEPRGKGRRGGPEEPFEFRDIFLSTRTMSLFNQTDTNDFYYAIWSRSGNLMKRSTNAPADLSPPVWLETETGLRTRMRHGYREAVRFSGMGECILVGHSIVADLKALHRFAGWLVAAGAAVLALGLGGGWWVAGRALRPVQDISAAASRISVGNLAERINVAETDNELGRLAGVLNSTFARLEAAFAQQKQFTADASHELRTPIAVIISEAQTTLARQRSAAEYRETVEACLEAAQQMSRLTQSLLELARYDAGQEQIERRPFDLAERTRACLEFLRPLAEKHGLQIHCDLVPAEVLGDAERLDRAITNLLTNAIHYNKPNGEIRVRTGSENGAAVLTVADTGQGIAPEDLPHVFERFYRADKSRAHAEGRNGLGLAICKAIVDAHGGSIAVSSESGTGSTFTVRLPLK